MRLLELFEQITPRREKQMQQDFTCGSCMYLALVLNQKYGWPLAGIFGEDEDGPYIFHVWVEPDKWTAVDIYGVHDKEELMSRWLEKSDVEVEYVRDVSPERVRNISLDTIVSRGQEKTHHNILKQAYRAMQHLLPQMQDEGLVEQITSRRVKHMEQEFSCGSCMYLALVLNAKYNWPLVGFLSYDDADELEGIIHIWVEPPGTQKAVDIYGVHDVGKFTNELEETSKLYGGEYEHDISPELIKRFIWSGQVYYPRKDRMFYDDRMLYGDEPHPQRKTQQEKFHKQALKQAYRAMQDYLIPQMQQQGLLEHESLLEDQAIRTYDPGVVEWIQKALQRPDADELYLHGSRQEQEVFDPKSKSHKLALLHFSKLTDPWFAKRNVAYQAEYYGPKLWLVKLNFKKPFDVRYANSEAAQMQDELVPKHYYQHRLSYEELHEITGPALERGYDMFVVFEIAAGTESYAVPDHNQVQIVDTYDARERKRAVNESMADQLIDSKVARKFTYVAMAIRFHKEQSTMIDMIERAASEFVHRVKTGEYATIEDAEHDRDIVKSMIERVANKFYLHDEIRQSSKTAQILAGSLNLTIIGSFQGTQEPVDGSQAVNTPTLS